MTIDLSNLSPDQEKVLIQAFRYLRQRAAYLRARQAADSPAPAKTDQIPTHPTPTSEATYGQSQG